jgi:hypothetical protein
MYVGLGLGGGVRVSVSGLGLGVFYVGWVWVSGLPSGLPFDTGF